MTVGAQGQASLAPGFVQLNILDPVVHKQPEPFQLSDFFLQEQSASVSSAHCKFAQGEHTKVQRFVGRLTFVKFHQNWYDQSSSLDASLAVS